MPLPEPSSPRLIPPPILDCGTSFVNRKDKRAPRGFCRARFSRTIRTERPDCGLRSLGTADLRRIGVLRSLRSSRKWATEGKSRVFGPYEVTRRDFQRAAVIAQDEKLEALERLQKEQQAQIQAAHLQSQAQMLSMNSLNRP